MKELEELRNGLMNSSIMLLNERDGFLECSFVKEGLVNCTVKVEDEVLMELLYQKATSGIVEGIHFNTFKYEFDSFAIHVKARKLYTELAYNLPMYLTPAPKEEAFEQTIGAAVA